MGHRNREIEKKFVLRDVTVKQAIKLVRSSIEDSFVEITAGSWDYYWKSPKPKKADFIRLRYMPDGSGQLTLKHSDRKHNFNRVEIDVSVVEPDQASVFLTRLYGSPDGSIYKDYTVFILDDKDTSVSIYKVDGDSRIFFEVEARTERKVNELVAHLSKSLDMDFEPRSLYQIFVEDKE